jgi:stage V sporulation protein G
MPSKKDKNGRFRDIVHPIEISAREEMEKEIMEKYNKAKETLKSE